MYIAVQKIFRYVNNDMAFIGAPVHTFGFLAGSIAKFVKLGDNLLLLGIESSDDQFQRHQYWKDIILHAVFSMSAMSFFIAILKKFWRKGELKLIMPHSIAGLFAIYLP
jgi:hypothetical protein